MSIIYDALQKVEKEAQAKSKVTIKYKRKVVPLLIGMALCVAILFVALNLKRLVGPFVTWIPSPTKNYKSTTYTLEGIIYDGKVSLVIINTGKHLHWRC